jgi:hypothetical protein
MLNARSIAIGVHRLIIMFSKIREYPGTIGRKLAHKRASEMELRDRFRTDAISAQHDVRKRATWMDPP